MKPHELVNARDEFASEAHEMLEQIEQLLPSLRTEAARGAVPADLVNHLFRQVHSLKGLSGMLGYSTIAFLAHDLENLLSELRMGRLQPSAELIALLENCLAAFYELVDAAEGGSEHAVSIHQLLGRLEAYVSSHRRIETLQLADHLELPETIRAALTEYEESRLLQHLRHHSSLFLVQVSFDFATFDEDLEQLTLRIRTTSEVITTLPSGEGLSEDRIGFELLVASALSAAELRSELEPFAPQVEAIPCRLPPEPLAVVPKAVVQHEEVLREQRSIRVPPDKIDAALSGIGDLLLVKSQIGHLLEELRSRYGLSAPVESLGKSAARLEKSLLALQDRLVQMRMIPVRSLFGRLAHLAQKLARELGKEVELLSQGEDTELDKMVIDEMTDPLLHLARNAVDHGIELPQERLRQGKPAAGRIQIRASHQGRRILIEVEDDGCGIDSTLIRRKAEERGLIRRGAALEEQELYGLLFTPGFSTRDSVTEISGRGVGMDVVKEKVVKLGGAIEILSKPGSGTRWTIVLPVTLVIIPSLIVRVADQAYAVPMSSISRTYDLVAGDVPGGISDEGFDFEGSVLPVHRLDQLFELERGADEPPPYLLVAHSAERKVGFLVHEIRGREEIVVKPLGRHLSGVRGIAGATELGDGRPVLVLDLGALVAEATSAAAEPAPRPS